MFYAKLVGGCPAYAPCRVLWRGCWVVNPHPEKLRELGYKPLVFTEQQAAPEGYGWAERWEETDDSIFQRWELAELPPEGDLDPAEALEILLGGSTE